MSRFLALGIGTLIVCFAAMSSVLIMAVAVRLYLACKRAIKRGH